MATDTNLEEADWTKQPVYGIPEMFEWRGRGTKAACGRPCGGRFLGKGKLFGGGGVERVVHGFLYAFFN